MDDEPATISLADCRGGEHVTWIVPFREVDGGQRGCSAPSPSSPPRGDEEGGEVRLDILALAAALGRCGSIAAAARLQRPVEGGEGLGAEDAGAEEVDGRDRRDEDGARAARVEAWRAEVERSGDGDAQTATATVEAAAAAAAYHQALGGAPHSAQGTGPLAKVDDDDEGEGEDGDEDEAAAAAEEEGGGQCMVCMARRADAALVECGHAGLCGACAGALWRRGERRCPLCRRGFAGVVRILSESGDGVVRFLFPPSISPSFHVRASGG
jgi:hypothetical protein